MKKYVVSLVLVCLSVSCATVFLQTPRKKLIDVFDDARKRVELVTCKIRRAISPSEKKEAAELLTRIETGFTTLRTLVADAFNKNSFDESRLQKTLSELFATQEKLSIFESLDEKQRAALKGQADQIGAASLALVAEAGALDLWVQGYAAYVQDLEDNFKSLSHENSNQCGLKRPDFKKLYEELGMSSEQGQTALFAVIQKKYQERFNALKKHYGEQFDDLCFKPYLRVLQYIFRTPYSKMQYDAFLSGEALYALKAKALAPYKQTIQKFFGQDLPELTIIVGTLKAEFC
ncbi:hypothetical protein CVU75_01445 [Candidatus Dependentiae bacterium HGW-Dependentiae-1]|nr:MAG: hypothetical protein CVU75_01445 [Candidatus Dependentiae bacterium HGW-Dependentiae-1]